MKRLFLPIKDFKFYNDLVDLLLVQSQICNGGAIEQTNAYTLFWDRRQIESYLYGITGDANGRCLINGVDSLASKPTLQMQLADIEKRFETHKKTRVGLGYERPTEMPREMLEEFYTCKARITVLMEEELQLRKRLATYTDKEKSENDSHVLFFGLQCACKTHGLSSGIPSLYNTMKFIDGQTVQFTEEGVLVISDTRSPYNGMAVSDYRNVSKQWRQERKVKEKEDFRRLQEKLKAEGKHVPVSPPVTSMKKVSRASLPKWPEWAKNYLINEPVTNI